MIWNHRTMKIFWFVYLGRTTTHANTHTHTPTQKHENEPLINIGRLFLVFRQFFVLTILLFIGFEERKTSTIDLWIYKLKTFSQSTIWISFSFSFSPFLFLSCRFHCDFYVGFNGLIKNGKGCESNIYIFFSLLKFEKGFD